MRYQLFSIALAAACWAAGNQQPLQAGIMFQFEGNGAWNTTAGGWGADVSETTGTLLAAQFNSTSIDGYQHELEIGQSFDLQVGQIQFLEPNAAGGIRINERDGLGAFHTLKFALPAGAEDAVLTGAGVATTGPLGDPAVDLTLTFQPVLITFGQGGLFQVELGVRNLDGSIGPVSFTDTQQIRDIYTRITLLEAPIHAPEPTSLALAGVAGLGFIARAIRRRRTVA